MPKSTSPNQTIQVLDDIANILGPIEYQPSGEGGTRSPPATPAKFKIAAQGPQNARRCLERYLPLPLGFWVF